ncbi:MAG TPA: hypothetical protein VHO84_15325 [Syntrophorhabdaceae bacterium]|nr:hypothetical protein [Syntrophorhabdaceae bacterium]
MSEVLKTWWLTNGVIVKITDESVQTSPDIWNLRLSIRATVEVKTSYIDDFQDTIDYLEILRMILPSTEYNREIMKTNVKSGNLEAEKAFLLNAFERDALFYFEKEDFPQRYVRNLYQEIEKKISAKRAIKKKKSDEFL